MSASFNGARTYNELLGRAPEQGVVTTPTRGEWSLYFGTPSRTQGREYDNISSSTWGLPYALQGRSAYLEEMFTTRIISNNDFLFTIMPIQVTADLKVQWERTYADATLVETVAERGPHGFLETFEQRGSASMLRYMLGLRLQYGFMTTPKGRKHYQLLINAIARSFVETALMDCAQELLNVGFNQARYEASMNLYSNKLREILRNREVRNFGIIQRLPNAIEVLDNEIGKIFGERQRQIPGQRDYIIPNLAREYVTYYAKEKTQYYLGGPPVPGRIEAGPGALTNIGGSDVYVFTNYSSETDSPAPNLLAHKRQIGEFTFANDQFRGSSQDMYSSKSRSVCIFSMEQNKYCEIKLDDMFLNSHMIDPESPNGSFLNMNDVSNEYYEMPNVSEYYGSGTALEYRREDESSNRPIDFLGNSNPGENDSDPSADLTSDDFMDAARAIAKKLPYSPHDLMNKFNSAVKVLDAILKADITKPQSIAFTQAIRDQFLTGDDFSVDPRQARKPGLLPFSSNIRESKKNRHGFVDLPVNSPEGGGFATSPPAWAGMGPLPPFFSPYSGLATIAAAIDEFGGTDQQFFNTYGFTAGYARDTRDSVNLFKEIADTLNIVSPGNVLLNPMYVSPWLEPDIYNAFVSNLLVGHMHPLFMFATAEAAGAPPAAELIASSISSKLDDETFEKLNEKIVNSLIAFGVSSSGASAEPNIKKETWETFVAKIKDALVKSSKDVSRWVKVAMRVRLLVVVMQSYFAYFPQLSSADKKDDMSKMLFNISSVFELPALPGLADLFKSDQLIQNMNSLTDDAFKTRVTQFVEGLISLGTNRVDASKSKSTKKTAVDTFRTSMENVVKDRLTNFDRRLKETIALVNDSTKYHEEVKQGETDKYATIDDALSKKEAGKTVRTPLTLSNEQYFQFLSVWDKYIEFATPSSPTNAEDFASPSDLMALDETYKYDSDRTHSTVLPSSLRPQRMMGTNIESTQIFSNIQGIGQIMDQTSVGSAINVDFNAVVPTYSGNSDSVANGDIDLNIHKSLKGNFATMFRRIRENHPNKLLSVLAQAYMGTPATKEGLLAGIRNNIPHMFNYILVRNSEIFTTEQMIAVTRGSGTNYIMPPTAVLGDDVHQRMHYANVLFYHKCVIPDPEGIVIIDDPIISGYHGGRGTRFIQRKDYNPTQGQFGYDNTTERASIISIMVPRNFNKINNVINLAGSFSSGSLFNDESEMPHYPTYKRYSDLFNFGRAQDAQESYRYSNSSNFVNLVCHTGPSLSWNAVDQAFNIIEVGNNHLDAKTSYNGSVNAILSSGEIYKSDPFSSYKPKVC